MARTKSGSPSDFLRFLKNGGEPLEYAQYAGISHEKVDKLCDERREVSARAFSRIGMDSSEDPDAFPDFLSLKKPQYARG